MNRVLARHPAAQSSTFTPVAPLRLQRKCACGSHTPGGGACAACEGQGAGIQRRLAIGPTNDPLEREADRVAAQVLAGPGPLGIDRAPPTIQRAASSPAAAHDDAPPSVHRAIAGSGRALEAATRHDMERRFGRDFSRVRVHQGSDAEQSAREVNAHAYTVGNDIVFGAAQYAPHTPTGIRLLAHELTHTVQQSSDSPAGTVRRSVVQRDAGAEGEPAAGAAAGQEGFEIDPSELRILPRVTLLPGPDSAVLQAPAPTSPAPSTATICDRPEGMFKVTSGQFVAGKTLDDYFPDLIGTNTWGSNNTAGPFDNGFRAGSSVQLYANLPIPCATSASPTTLGQTVTIVRMRANGAQVTEGGVPLEGQTINDIARSGRDSSQAPFRQTWLGAISMADPISGIPYNSLASYDFEANLTSSLTAAGGTVSVDWGVTVQAAAGRVTRNEVR